MLERTAWNSADLHRRKQQAGIDALTESELAANGIDVLVNNAGLALDLQGSRPVDEVFEDHLQVNVFGPIRLTQAALPLLRTGREKKIITTSSIMGSVESIGSKPGTSGATACA